MIILDDQAHQQMTLYFQCIEVAIGLEESFRDCSKLSFYYQLQHDYNYNNFHANTNIQSYFL